MSAKVRGQGIAASLKQHTGDNVPKVYNRIGVVGSSSSAESGRKSASIAFDAFLKSKQLRPSNELSESEWCNIGLFQEFGSYLVQNIKTNNITMGTALQYLSGAKSNGMLKYPNNSMWNDKYDSWMSGIRFSLTRIITDYHNELGQATSFKAPPIGRESQRIIGEYYLHTNTVEAFNRRAKINMTKAAVGRSAELSVTMWNNCRWDHDEEAWCLLWPESKTTSVKLIPFCHDYNCFESCVLHSLACAWTVGSSAFAGTEVVNLNASYIWPDLRNLGFGANSKMNEYLQALIPVIPEL